MTDAAKTLEAILFFKGEPLEAKELAKILQVDEETVQKAADELSEHLNGSGLMLLRQGREFSLGTSAEASETIEKISKEELSRELSKASLETLSVVIYMAPVRRSAIDYIRGVNSQFSLRHLEIRGLVRKIPDPTDARTFLYEPTLDLLAHLGVSRIEDIPDYEATKAKIESMTQKPDEEAKEEEK